MLSRSSSKIGGNNSNEHEIHHIAKDDQKYTGYLNGILREYSVKQASSDRNPFEFDEMSPKEIKTGTVTKIGHRNLSNWDKCTSSCYIEPLKKSDRQSTNRHALTKAKAIALLNKVQNRQKEVQEGHEEAEIEESDQIKGDRSYVLPKVITPSRTPTGPKYLSPIKSKGMIKSFHLFEVDPCSGPLIINKDLELDTTEAAELTLPKIGDPTNTRNVSMDSNSDSKKESAADQNTSDSRASSRKQRERRMTSRLTKRQPTPTLESRSSPSSGVAKSVNFKRKTSTVESSEIQNLSQEQLSKYFGNRSKLLFFDTYREIHHLRDNVLGGNNEIDHYVTLDQKDLDKEIDELSSTYFSQKSMNYDDCSTITQDVDFDDFQVPSQDSPSASTSTGVSFRFSKSPNLRQSLKSEYLEDGSVSTMECNSFVSQISSRSFNPSSPRAKYLAGCIKNNVPPLSSLLLRDNMTSCLMLEHQGIGDKMGELLSTGLLDVPFIKSVNIADNNLTDASLTLIINAIAQRPSITDLNISRNKVGSDTARALGNYLRTSSCTIKRLVMRASNVDDTECHQFVEALGYNRGLEELDLSENLLGKDENLNAVKPDTVTAGESFAVLLHDCRCPIKILKIAWNMIRMEGAIQLCSSLQYQRHLRHLDISFNSLGSEGGLTLGNALLDNNVLEELLISNNSIDSAACFAICVGIREGKSVRFLNIDGNPIGEAGARILMRLPASCGGRVAFTARNCDISMKQSSSWFDSTDPVCKEILLDMSKPYELAVMYEILDLIARHPSYQFGPVRYGEDNQTKNWKDMNFIYLEEANVIFSQAEAEILVKLKKTVEISENIELCTKYFQASDSDGSGELSEDEFFDILDRLELSLSDRQKLSAMTLYDSDHSGAIQLEEFQEFINEVAKDSRLKIHDIETTPRCAESTSPNQRYHPPRRGVFLVTIVNGYQIGESGRALTEEQVRNMIAMAKHSSSPSTLMQYAAESDLLRLNEAQELYNHIVTECGDPAVAIATIIPHMTSTTDAKNLITLCCGDDETISNKLQFQFGNAYRPMIGLADGYYSLDFSDKNDRLCMTKLLELSTTCASRRQANKLGDVSQDGNWSCFRNEYFSGQEVRLSTSFLSAMPKYGRIEFDFVGADRFISTPASARDTSTNNYGNVISITDRKIIQVLIQINLLSSQHIHWAYDELTSLRSVCRKSLSTGGSTPYWSCSMGRILEAQRYKYEKFYSNLKGRSSQLDRATKREQKYSQLLPSASKLKRAFSKGGVGLTSLGIVSDEEDENEDDLEENHLFDPHESFALMSGTFESSSPLSPSPYLSPKSTTDKTPKKSTLSARDIQSSQTYENGFQACALCAKFVHLVEQHLSNKWILVRHLILLLKCFSIGSLKKTDFGTYRVEVVVSLFCRIKDTHNLHLIFSTLTSEEHGMILARIGILNIFDPIRPEGAYSLDLSVWEERQVCKMLIHIAAVEPGSNWLTQIYQFDRNSKPSSGWVLTVNWYTEEGLPTKGLVSLAYTCGYGVRMNGCSPVYLHRRHLIPLVSHRSDFYQYDDLNPSTEITPVPSGIYTLEKANELLSSLDADIKWNYNPLCLMHE